MSFNTAFASGARVKIHGAEWVVHASPRPLPPAPRSSWSVFPRSSLGREPRFRTEIEGKTITVLDPADTKLVPDALPRFRDTRLYLESLLRPTGRTP